MHTVKLRSSFLLGAVAAAALLAGCVDEAQSPLSPRTEHPVVNSASSGEPGPDVVIRPRFEIGLDVEGVIKPGRPIHLTLIGHANYATQDAEVRLILPEVAAAKRSGWDLVELPVGEELTPEFRMRRAFSAGERFRERATITIPEPGYYYVLATVIQHSDDERTDDGYMIGAGAARELWLWVDEHGGRVTERFDPTLFPEGTRRIRGPFGSERRPPRTRDGGVVITCTLIPGGDYVISSACPGRGDTVVVSPPTGPTATAAVKVTYSDAGAGGMLRPLADARVLWKVVNTVTNSQAAGGSGYTDANGVIPTINCAGPTSERRLEVTVHTYNAKVEVKSYITANADRTLAGQFYGACGESIPITADNHQAHLFSNMNKNHDGHVRFFGNPPTIMRAGLYPPSAYGTRYDWGAADVRIEPATFDHIWREHGVMVAAHEWGHLWQDQYIYMSPASNGLKRFYNLACPQRHPPGEYTNFGCALGEAFADWYAVVIRESDLPNWRRDMEENRFHLLQCGLKCTQDGSIVQGAVHAFLWDITDAAFTEGHDRVQKRPADVVQAIKGCEVSIDRVEYKPYTGIDHLIWCMEYRFPYQVRMQTGSGEQPMTFFDTRAQSQWPVIARWYFPVDAYNDDFRRLWLVNLYSKRAGVGNVPIFRQISSTEDPSVLPPAEPPPPCDSVGLHACAQ
jgi:hypothetical protein